MVIRKRSEFRIPPKAVLYHIFLPTSHGYDGHIFISLTLDIEILQKCKNDTALGIVFQ